jgi:hypothetical protein
MEADWSTRAARVLGAWCAVAATLAVLVGGGAPAGGWLEPRVAVCFVLSGGTLWALRSPPSPLRRRIADVAATLTALIALFAMTPDRPPIFRMGQRLAVAAGFIAFLTVVASAYGATAVGPEAYAALALVVLAIGVTAARPGAGATGIFVQDTAGGTVARWLLPATVLGTTRSARSSASRT